MAEQRELFDKPMTELREAFVRARFAQEDVFGLLGIEAWLAGQRAGERGSQRPWLQLIQRGRLTLPSFDVARLHEMAVPSTLKVMRDIGVDERGNVDACYTLLGGLDERYADVYAVGPDLHLVVRKRRGVPYQAVAITSDTREVMRTPSPRYSLRPATDADFLRAVLDLGLGPPSSPKRVRENARKFLCDTLAEEIKRERAKAEADFDSAVAVSADGTKIVHADWVLILGQATDGSQDLRFPASAFWKRKIFRTGPCSGCTPKLQPWRNDSDGGDWTVQRFFTYVSTRVYQQWSRKYGYASMTLHTRATPPEQILVCLKDGRILLVHRDQCPDPLPE